MGRAVWGGIIEDVVRGSGGKLKLDLIDISRAHFNPTVEEKVYVELPPERQLKGKCGRLIHNLYGGGSVVGGALCEQIGTVGF